MSHSGHKGAAGQPGKGLRELIQSAASVEEVSKWLTEGKTFEFASRKTRNSWKNTANRRISVLSGKKVEAPKPVEQPQEEFVSEKKRRQKRK